MILIPVEAPIAGGWHDRVRLALSKATMPAGHSHKRFAANIAGCRLELLTEAQWRQVMRLAWRYRRSMPVKLVPDKAAVKALDAWQPRPVLQLEHGDSGGITARRTRRLRIRRPIAAPIGQADLESWLAAAHND